MLTVTGNRRGIGFPGVATKVIVLVFGVSAVFTHINSYYTVTAGTTLMNFAAFTASRSSSTVLAVIRKP